MIEHSMPTIGKEEQDAIIDVIKTKYLAEGKIVKEFEDKLSAYIGSRGCIVTSTGTLALHLALLNMDVKKNDEVMLPSYTCRAVLNAVLYTGAKPILCDINKDDYNMSFNEAKKKINRKTKVIIVPHMFGCPAEIDKFKELGVYIIEDCAHSIGAEYKGKRVGSWGDLSIFSFEGTKYIVTGEGGAVLANSGVLLNKLRRLKEPDSADYKIKYTYRMTNLQAAIGMVQLLKLNSFIKRRRQIAHIYTQALSYFNVDLPKEYPERLHIFHRYVIKIKGNTNGFMKICYKKGIKVKQPVKPYPLHHYLSLSDKSYPNTAYIMRSAVSIPIYPSLNNKEIRLILDTIREGLVV